MTHLSVFLLAVLFSCAIAQEFNAPTQQNTEANAGTFLPPTQQQQQEQVPTEQTQQNNQQNQQNPPAEQLRAPVADNGTPLQTTPLPPRRPSPPRRDDNAICNPVTGIRARGGSIYAGLLNRMGVQGGNCGGRRNRQPNQNNQEGGTVNPITGIRARQGGIYQALLNGAGVRNNQGNNQNNNGNNANNANNANNGNNNQNDQEGGTINPITGIRARQGGIYQALLNGAGVRNNQGNNQGNQGNQQNQQGTVNPITGVRARQGSIYQALLNGAGVNNNGDQEGVGLFGNNPLVRFINANGGLIAAADQNTNAPAITPAQSGVPSWVVAGAVLLSVLVVATIAVMVQLVVLIRSS